MSTPHPGPTAADLRAAIDWITDRSPRWDERNMLAVQRLNLAIAELLALRAVAAAARDYGAAHESRLAEGRRLRAANYQGNTEEGAAYSALLAAEYEAQDALFAAWRDEATDAGAGGQGEE